MRACPAVQYNLLFKILLYIKREIVYLMLKLSSHHLQKKKKVSLSEHLDVEWISTVVGRHVQYCRCTSIETDGKLGLGWHYIISTLTFAFSFFCY